MKTTVTGFYWQVRRKVRRKLLKSLQPCSEMTPLMSQSLDRRLGTIEQLKLKLHLLVCDWCCRYFAQINLLKNALSLKASLRERDKALPTETRERILRRLSAESTKK